MILSHFFFNLFGYDQKGYRIYTIRWMAQYYSFYFEWYLECIRQKISYREYWNQFRIKAYTSSDALESVNFPRLKYTPYHRWFDEGAICRVVFKADIPVAFSWTHYKEHSIGNVGIFDMGDSIAWLGPYFVHKNYRGLSLQQLMINQDVSNASENITSFITSVNQRNTASLHSFLKLNFFIGGCSVFSHGKTTINIKEGVCPYLKIK
jgi:hypothetical protein